MVPPGRRQKDYSPTDWDEYWAEKRTFQKNGDVFNYYTMGNEESKCCILVLHGGGFSGLSFSLFGKQLREMADCFIIAPDIRGHGGSHCENETSLSIENLTEDMVSFYEDVVQHRATVIIGHSMGGALAVHVSHRTPCIGLVVIDVVEGSALEALPSMEVILRGRPGKFKSVDQAIEWAVRTNYIKNLQSAKISMPGQVQDKSPSSEDSTDQIWRINLSETANYWRGWFEGLSEKFLNAPPVKMLLLAGMDRLDTALTVGQMQGKFQLSVMPTAGHAIHEDEPLKVAELIATFITRHKFADANPNFTPQSAIPGLGGLGRMRGMM